MIERLEGGKYSFGLVGWPLGHSLSPSIHASALEASGLSGEYRLYPIPPENSKADGLGTVLARMRRYEVQGLNVTIPYKQAVIPFLDELSETAQAIGAVNVIYLERGLLVGDNSDAPAFLKDVNHLLSAGAGVQADRSRISAGEPGTAIVLGAGGSARAVVYALIEQGWIVYLAARRSEASDQLAADLVLYTQAQAGQIIPLPLESASLSGLINIDLLVNATPCGMAPDFAGNPWPEGLPLPEDAAVYDLVYNPPETALLRVARRAGLPATNGLGMLVEQAALAFERWTGRVASRQAMSTAARQGRFEVTDDVL
jgi:shikimate dehydrogenase